MKVENVALSWLSKVAIFLPHGFTLFIQEELFINIWNVYYISEAVRRIIEK